MKWKSKTLIDMILCLSAEELVLTPDQRKCAWCEYGPTAQERRKDWFDDSSKNCWMINEKSRGCYRFMGSV
jgi:hypothetical protein